MIVTMSFDLSSEKVRNIYRGILLEYGIVDNIDNVYYSFLNFEQNEDKLNDNDNYILNKNIHDTYFKYMTVNAALFIMDFFGRKSFSNVTIRDIVNVTEDEFKLNFHMREKIIRKKIIIEIIIIEIKSILSIMGLKLKEDKK